MNLIERLKTFNIADSSNRDALFGVIVIIILFFLLIFFLFRPNIQPPQEEVGQELEVNEPVENTVIQTNEEGNLILYENTEGQKILESLNIEKSREEAITELGIEDDENITYIAPFAAGERAVTEEEIEQQYEEEWGIPYDWGE